MNGGTVMDGIIRLGQALGPLQALFSVVCYAAALFLAFLGTREMVRVAWAPAGSPPQGLSWGSVGTTYFVAVMFAAFPQAMATAEMTVFGQGSPLSYRGVDGVPMADSSRQALGVIIGYMQLLGWVFFMRGWLMLRKAAQGKIEGAGPAWTQVISGILLADIVHTVNVISSTIAGRDFFLIN